MKRLIGLTSVLILLLFSSSLAFTGLGAGVRAGMIQNYKNPGLDAFPASLSLERMPVLGAHLKIGTLPLVDFELSAEYAWKKKEVTVSIGTEGLKGDLTVSDFSLNATAKYHLSVPVFKPYLGAGAGFHRLIYKLDIEGLGEQIVLPENESRLGLHVVAGIGLKASALPFEIFAEGRYTHIKTRQEELDTSSTNYPSIMAGVTFNL